MPRLQIADVGLAAFGSRRLQLPLITITDLILIDQTLTQQVPACPACLSCLPAYSITCPGCGLLGLA